MDDELFIIARGRAHRPAGRRPVNETDIDFSAIPYRSPVVNSALIDFKLVDRWYEEMASRPLLASACRFRFIDRNTRAYYFSRLLLIHNYRVTVTDSVVLI